MSHASPKQQVVALLSSIETGATEPVASIDPDRYAQHNLAVADGLSGLGAALKAMAEQGVAMVYERNHLVLGEGSFVLSVSEGRFAGKHVSFYDLFRVEGGKIAEHWDTIEEIAPRAEWRNDNGKFGF